MAAFLFIFFLIFTGSCAMNNTYSSPLVMLLEQKLELLFVDYAMDVTKWLEKINDGNFKDSEIGRLLRYEEIKPHFSTQIEKTTGPTGRGMKKMELMMMPLIFHLGVTSTWVVVTTILAAKSVAIGIILLIFKIAGSSAKLASYFTAWKGHHQHQWGWTPHHDHHDHHESIPAVIHSSPAVVHPSGPWAPALTDYKSSHDVTK